MQRLLTPRVGVIAIALLSFALRIATAGSQSYWYDEVFTVRVIDGGLASLWEGVRELETTPPLYYWLAWGWTQLFGVGELGLRSLSAVLGTAGVLMAMRLGNLLGGVRVALWAGALCAVNPFLVWFGQEARAYVLLALCAAALPCAMVQWRRAPERWRNVVEFSAWAAVAIATHYFGWVLVAAAALTLLVLRFAWRRVAVALAAPALVALSLVPLLRHHDEGGRTNWITEQSLPRRIAQALRQFMVGLDAPQETAIGVALLTACVVLIGVGLLRARSRDVTLVAVLASSVFVVSLAGALAGVDLVLGRNLIAVVPATLTLVTVGAASGRAWSGVAGAVAVVMCVVSVLITTDTDHARPDWRGALDAIPEDVDAVFVVPSMQDVVVEHYRPDLEIVGEGAGAALAGTPISGGQYFALPTSPEPVTRRDFGQVELALYD